MKNSKGQTLPQPYLALAEMRREQKCGVKDVTIMLSSAFNWATTLEGYDWWSSVFKGNKPSIHYASLAELDEWRKAKATISKMGTVEPGYKAKYEAEKEMAEYYEKQYNVLKDAVITPTAELQSTDRNWIAGGDVMEFQDIEDRAMEIYAEMQIKAIKEYADSFHGSGHEYWFILGKIDDLIRHKLNQFKTTKP